MSNDHGPTSESADVWHEFMGVVEERRWWKVSMLW